MLHQGHHIINENICYFFLVESHLAKDIHSVSNSSGPALWVWVQVGTDPFHIGGPGRQCTRTVNSGKVRWTSHSPSELGGLLVGRPVAPSVASYNALVLAVSY